MNTSEDMVHYGALKRAPSKVKRRLHHHPVSKCTSVSELGDLSHIHN
jgi:hypothetical protein